jgi:hypothetical protein
LKKRQINGRSVIKSKLTNPYLHWAKRTINAHIQKGFVVILSPHILEMLVRVLPFCALCGGKLKFNAEKNDPLLPSLDRSDNSHILTINNIQVLHSKCNSMKSDNTMKELVEWCKLILKRHSK